MAGDDVIVRFGGSLEGLTNAVTGAKETIESLAAPFTGLQSAFAGLGEAFAAAFALEKVKSFAEEMASIGTETNRYSQILGVSKEQVAGLDLLAKASGGSIEELATAYGRFSKNVATGSEDTKRALSAIGVSFDEIKKLNPEHQFELLAERFAKFADGSGKAAAAQMLFGRAGIQLIPILNQGAEGVRHRFEVAQELEPALARNVDSMEEMHRAELANVRGIKRKGRYKYGL